MKWEFFKNKNKGKLLLAIDIGTEAVKTLVLRKNDLSLKDKNKKQPFKISVLSASAAYFSKEIGDMAAKAESDTSVFKEGIYQSIKEAERNLCFSLAKKATKENARIKKNTQVLVTLPPTFFKGRVARGAFVRQNYKDKIDKAEQDRIFRKIIKDSQRGVVEKSFIELGVAPKDVFWVSLKIIEKKIDGYRVPDLIGCKGKEIELKIFSSFIPEDYLKNIKKAFSLLKFDNLKIIHPASNLNFFGDKEKENGVFIDVGGDITQFYIIKEGFLMCINDFKMGGRDFSRIISENFGIDKESARILKEKYSNHSLSEGALHKIKDVFTRAKRVWRQELSEVLQKDGYSKIAAANIYLFGGASLAPEIKESFMALPEESPLTDSYFIPVKLELIYPGSFKDVEDLTTNLNSPQFINPLLISENA